MYQGSKNIKNVKRWNIVERDDLKNGKNIDRRELLLNFCENSFLLLGKAAREVINAAATLRHASVKRGTDLTDRKAICVSVSCEKAEFNTAKFLTVSTLSLQ